MSRPLVGFAFPLALACSLLGCANSNRTPDYTGATGGAGGGSGGATNLGAGGVPGGGATGSGGSSGSGTGGAGSTMPNAGTPDAGVGAGGSSGVTGGGGASGMTGGVGGGQAGTSPGVDTIITIDNGGYWNDTGGKRIEAHGAGLIRVGSADSRVGSRRGGCWRSCEP